MKPIHYSRREMLAVALGAATGGAMRPVDAADRWDALREFMDAEKAAGTFPGAAVIAFHDGKIRFERQIGTYCGLRGRELALDGRVLHPLYSFSKVVSATVIAMVVAEGLLEWDKPVRAYIPEFTGGGKDEITLRHLLTHGAGIPRAPLGMVPNETAWQEAVKVACAATTEWEPGTRTAYHGLSGQFVAAEAVRRVSGGKPWAAICRERLFQPLGADTLTFELPPESTPVALTPQPQELPTSLAAGLPFAGHPGGGCLGTPADALKVLQLHLNRGKWRGKRLLRENVWREMHTVQYAKEIAAARQAGKGPVHEPFGLGPLLRGEGPKSGAHDWFGFANQPSPTVFGHAGISTVIGVGDPATGSALFFVTTDVPKPEARTATLRNGITDRVLAALAS